MCNDLHYCYPLNRAHSCYISNSNVRHVGQRPCDFGEVLKQDPGLTVIFSESMQAFRRADRDCLQFVDFNGVHKVIDLGGTGLLIEYMYITLSLLRLKTIPQIIFYCGITLAVLVKS